MQKKLINDYELLCFLKRKAKFYYFLPKIPLFLQICSKIPPDLGSKDPLFLPPWETQIQILSHIALLSLKQSAQQPPREV